VWEDVEKFFAAHRTVLALLLALLGGVVRSVRCEKSDFTIWGLLQRLLAALFVGALATLILSGVDMPDGVRTAVAGSSGYAANDLLGCLLPWVRKKIGL
jgi:hypothetical protein